MPYDLTAFPNYFKNYRWNGKHMLFGYPEDAYKDFCWICSLENRFQWLKENCNKQKTASVYLLKEMIQWGGSQNGTLQKFEDGSGEVNFYELIKKTIDNLNDPKNAISAALELPGMGLTYASKMLRFLEPEKYGALDNRIRKAFENEMPNILPNINDSSKSSMIKGYVSFTNHLNEIKEQLDQNKTLRPDCALPVGSNSSGWRSADIEMALFGWASSN